MKRPRVLLGVIAANLVVLVALVFIYPDLMISPGPLSDAHATLSTDCFACHAPLRGASSGRCVACHAVADIGLRNTRGETLVSRSVRSSFHQQLIEQDCMACHSDHEGPRLARRHRKVFSHDLLKVAVRQQCSSCHVPPVNALHRNLKVECSQCHQVRGWKPATFDHARFFVLDRDHSAPCETCHRGNDYSQYTCYGCHEHSEEGVRAEHAEEGIRDFRDSVACHRDPAIEPGEGGGRRLERPDDD